MIALRRKAEFYAAALFVLYAAILLANRPSPSLTDYCDWTYEGVLLRGRMLGMPDPAHLLKHYPVPNSATTLGVALLALVFSWQLAAKLWLCVVLLAAFVASWHMMRSCRGEERLWLIAPAAIFLNVNLWYGFINFQLGLCWAILTASFLLRDERREWVFGLLLLLAFFSHMIPFAFAALLVILYAAQAKRYRLLWQLLPAGLLGLWYLAGRFLTAHNADGEVGIQSKVAAYSAAFWAYKANSYLKSLGFINPGNTDGSVAARVLGPVVFSLLFLANALLCIAVGWCLISAAVSAYRRRKQERFIWNAALLLFPVYLLAPATALGVSDPGSRLLQTALAATLFLCAARTAIERQLLRFGAGCAVALQVAALALFIRVVFSPEKQVAAIPGLPHLVVVFAHVPNHAEDYFYRALERGDMSLHIFPTAMFLNTPQATTPPNRASASQRPAG